MSKIKLYGIIAIILFVVGMLGTIKIQHDKIEKISSELVISDNNFKAIVQELDSSTSKNREYKLTIDQLNNSNDSLFNEMNKVRKQLKIKDKEIERLGYIASLAKKADTLYFRDTIFVENTVIDTTITDDWYKCNVQLTYPNIVSVSPEFKSEKYVVTHITKEIPNPSKCFIVRWFQKKVTVVETEVVENNPYITTKKERFLEVKK